MEEGEFQKLQKYILERALLPNGTPIFSARHFATMIDEAKKEFPMNFVWVNTGEGSNPRIGLGYILGMDTEESKIKELYNWFVKWFGSP